MAYSYHSTCRTSWLVFLFLISQLVFVSLLYWEPRADHNYYRVDIKKAALGIQSGLENVNTVTGIAPQSGNNGCDLFACPTDHKAVRTSYSPEHVKNNTMTHYCLCLPKVDALFLDWVLRIADMTSHTVVLQQQRRHLHKLQAQAKVEATRIPASSRKSRTRSGREVPVAKDTNFTYVPPPKTDVTPGLLAESLAVQPQDTATVGSVMPYFQDGVISYGIQLNGLIAASMTLNASTSLPCASIGSQAGPQPDLILRPKDIDNGTAQAYIPDCNIVAVNMYDPNIIHYWVMNPAGAIFSLVGSNKLMQIDQLNSTASMSLVLRASSASNIKRGGMTADISGGRRIAERAMSLPDVHTATMTAEACAAIKCNSNGGQAAVFQPFTRSCLCQNPVYVEIEHV